MAQPRFHYIGIKVTINYGTGRDWYDIDLVSVGIAGVMRLVGLPGLEKLREFAKDLDKVRKISAKADVIASKIPLKSNPGVLQNCRLRWISLPQATRRP